MRSNRSIVIAGGVALALALRAGAQPPDQKPPALPVRAVTLFSSGVAYTERRGEVENDAAVPLLFRVGQVNDILKSMVLLDSAGKVQPATYASRDPVGHTLRSFAFDVTGDMSLEQILNQLRGAQVSVESPGKPAIVGQIVSVQQKQVAGEDQKPIMASFLNLLTDPTTTSQPGLMSIRLDGDRSIRFLDERLNREFRAALGLLASSSDDQRRQVTLHFDGVGRREVRVGYVTEAPIWKMSYRLLVGGAAPDRPGGKPYLQGWAMVENTSDDDWQGVRLSLVSGRPVSFIEDLYQPLYIPRPEVGPDVVASPVPQTHDSDLATGKDAAKKEAGLAEKPDSNQPTYGRAGTNGTNARGAGRPGAAGGSVFGGGFGGPAAPAGPTTDKLAEEREMLRQSVAAQATGQKAGALFQYNITSPVTLPRQQAALIPVIAQDVDAEKVLLFNADSGSRFPLNAVRVRNVTGLHLKGGPVTLFDDGVYAGDARMEDVPPGDSRLLSYAVDLSVEGERQGPSTASVETSMSLRRGVLIVGRRERIETTYTLKSKSDKARTVLVEHPFRAEYKLIAPEKAAERTAELYRFSVPVAAGQAQTLKVVVERPLSQGFAIVDAGLDALESYSMRKEMSAKLRETLQEVVRRRRHVLELQAAAANRAQEVTSISADQERIRKNMNSLDRASALYKRYVAELDAQETRIENLRQEAVRLRAQAETADRDLRAYIDGIGSLD